MHPVQNRQQAITAIDDIIEEGEGTPSAGPQSHYQVFLEMAHQLKQLQQDRPGFDPARDVASDPMTRSHRDNRGGGTPIRCLATRDIAELFNAIYGTMLLTLTQYYNYAGETAAQRAALQTASVQLMFGVIRPLGMELTCLPVDDSPVSQNAGASFEIYGPLRLPADRCLAWLRIRERLLHESAEARRLSQLEIYQQPTRETLQRVCATVESVTHRIEQHQPHR